ncbi:unnamed protein product, partial [Phytophthora fragariaefolia]
MEGRGDQDGDAVRRSGIFLGRQVPLEMGSLRVGGSGSVSTAFTTMVSRHSVSSSLAPSPAPKAILSTTTNTPSFSKLRSSITARELALFTQRHDTTHREASPQSRYHVASHPKILAAIPSVVPEPNQEYFKEGQSGHNRVLASSVLRRISESVPVNEKRSVESSWSRVDTSIDHIYEDPTVNVVHNFHSHHTTSGQKKRRKIERERVLAAASGLREHQIEEQRRQELSLQRKLKVQKMSEDIRLQNQRAIRSRVAHSRESTAQSTKPSRSTANTPQFPERKPAVPRLRRNGSTAKQSKRKKKAKEELRHQNVSTSILMGQSLDSSQTKVQQESSLEQEEGSTKSVVSEQAIKRRPPVTSLRLPKRKKEAIVQPSENEAAIRAKEERREGVDAVLRSDDAMTTAPLPDKSITLYDNVTDMSPTREVLSEVSIFDGEITLNEFHLSDENNQAVGNIKDPKHLGDYDVPIVRSREFSENRTSEHEGKQGTQDDKRLRKLLELRDKAATIMAQLSKLRTQPDATTEPAQEISQSQRLEPNANDFLKYPDTIEYQDPTNNPDYSVNVQFDNIQSDLDRTRHESMKCAEDIDEYRSPPSNLPDSNANDQFVDSQSDLDHARHESIKCAEDIDEYRSSSNLSDSNVNEQFVNTQSEMDHAWHESMMYTEGIDEYRSLSNLSDSNVNDQFVDSQSDLDHARHESIKCAEDIDEHQSSSNLSDSNTNEQFVNTQSEMDHARHESMKYTEGIDEHRSSSNLSDSNTNEQFVNTQSEMDHARHESMKYTEGIDEFRSSSCNANEQFGDFQYNSAEQSEGGNYGEDAKVVHSTAGIWGNMSPVTRTVHTTDNKQSRTNAGLMRLIEETDDSLSVVDRVAKQLYQEQLERLELKKEQELQLRIEAERKELLEKDLALKVVMASLTGKNGNSHESGLSVSGDDNDMECEEADTEIRIAQYKRLEEIMDEVENERAQENKGNSVSPSFRFDEENPHCDRDQGWIKSESSEVDFQERGRTAIAQSSPAFWDQLMSESSGNDHSDNCVSLDRLHVKIDDSELIAQREAQMCEEKRSAGYTDSPPRLHSPRTLSKRLMAAVDYQEAIFEAHLQLSIMEHAHELETVQAETITLAQAFNEEMDHNAIAHQLALDHATLEKKFDNDIHDVIEQLDIVQQSEDQERAARDSRIQLELREANLRECGIQTESSQRADAATSAAFYVDTSTSPVRFVSDVSEQHDTINVMTATVTQGSQYKHDEDVDPHEEANTNESHELVSFSEDAFAPDSSSIGVSAVENDIEDQAKSESEFSNDYEEDFADVSESSQNQMTQMTKDSDTIEPLIAQGEDQVIKKDA